MPRNVRNFWVEVEVDGYKNPIKFGPREKDGGFEMVIKQRKEGKVAIGAYIRGFVTESGQIVLSIESGQNINHMEVVTKR